MKAGVCQALGAWTVSLPMTVKGAWLAAANRFQPVSPGFTRA